MDVAGVLGRRALFSVEAHFDCLLSGAVSHGIRFVQPHLVGKALDANSREAALNQDEIAGFHLMMKVDCQARDNTSQSAFAQIRERDARAGQNVPTCIVE